MAVVFHAAELPRGDRADATHSAFLDQIWPTTVRLTDAAADDSLLEAWDFGRTSIFQAHLTGMYLSRSGRQVRDGPAEVLTIARQDRDIGRHEQFGIQHTVAPGELMVVDMNEPYEFHWAERGSSHALYLPIDEVGLPREVVVAAAARLPASPLYALMSAHIRDLVAAGDLVSGTGAADALSDAAIDLARALLASAYGAEYGRAAMHDALLPRIRGYVRRRLADPELSPATIARAHDISVRTLFRLCAAAEFGLEQWITTNRLDGARAELARPELRLLPVAVIARRWGFANPSHFGRRFRELYGMTPGAWRGLAAAEPPP
ncbi:helix-turn-helix domain-containing protein [Nocardia asteroides]|uniref:helix-turn-helix domain-containing protein n=1 Tax=Nocardia asteroides TaxID=1824 RepID=UPI001E5FCC87|nr:helix-turn-helix domain-containing protein [Nocardia asteroides]UGT62651.1 helix-turn-helix domain-containing protein [Nocardia asteroides]